MASAAQIHANQANARHSTGPRTPEGKANSARNRTGHGLSSREFVILSGQEAEFEEFMDGLHQQIQPHGALENDLFTQFAHSAWNLRRCRIAERELQDSRTPGADPILEAEVTDRLRLIDLYMRRSERTYHRLLKELTAQQTNRQYTTDISIAARMPYPHAKPAPLSSNLALDHFRDRSFKQASINRVYTQMGRLMPDPASSLDEIRAALNLPPVNPTRRFEQSNPISSPSAAAATR